MKGYVFYDEYQTTYLEHLSKEHFRFKKILTHTAVEPSDFKKAPIFLILISQPSLKEMDRFKEMSWTAILVRRGVRFDDIARPHFTNVEEVRPLLETLEKNYEEEQKKTYLDSKQDKPARRSRFDFWKSIKKVYRFNGIITFLGDAEAAASFAKHYAKQSHQKVIIVDGNLLMPSMERHFNIRHLQTSIESHLTGIDNTGINIALDALGKKASLDNHLDKMTYKITNKLDLLIGNYNLYNYEHYDIALFERLMHSLNDAYDVVVLSVNAIIYDSLSLLGLHLSKANVIVCEDQIECIRYTVGVLDILKSKQMIKPDKTHVLHKKTSKKPPIYSESVLKEIFKKQFVGHFSSHLSENKKRKEMVHLMKHLEKRHLEWDS